MKLLLVVVALGLTVSICAQQLSAAPSIPVGTLCCERYIRTQLPLARIVNYIKAPSSFYCSHDAIIFQTVAGRLVCANPEHPWVQDRLTELTDRIEKD
ncbi:C-C motif chemokine 4 homolog [Chiloscyllium plagiosum]|uniref:C-C motif chemokine 4 homolog n=1 Tax=Chiloscyllium plagiosum TaxID=36176 RepID=UPI001CB7CE4B|nr:C-C motif chemokine 4 homolog [Chiloscyllium plagiosum]